MIAPFPVMVWVGSLLPVALEGHSGRGLFLRDGEAPGSDLLRIELVHVAVVLLEGRGVEAVGQHRGEAGDVLSGGELFGIALLHLLLDGVFENFDFGGGFGGQSLPVLQGFDFGDDFFGRHCVFTPFDSAVFFYSVLTGATGSTGCRAPDTDNYVLHPVHCQCLNNEQKRDIFFVQYCTGHCTYIAV